MHKGQAKVLIIDDDKDFVEATRLVLASGGYDVAWAGGTEEGMRRLEQEKPDLLILDMMMEGKGAGFVLSRRIRKDARFKSLPILMLTGMREQTGFSFPGKDKDSQFLPVDDFAEKPIKPQDLLARVGKLLEKARA
ncbi:MAG TPA: response regulator [Elusimicrobia bacterium]|nr:response regulator [Elusimicrobiota bacterium]